MLDSLLEDKILLDQENVSMLGTRWCQKHDIIISTLYSPFTFVDPGTPITKRTLFSCLAKKYDPMGFLSALIVKANLTLQKTWIDQGCIKCIHVVARATEQLQIFDYFRSR